MAGSNNPIMNKSSELPTDHDEYLDELYFERNILEAKACVIHSRSFTARFLQISWKIPGYFSHPDTADYACDSPPFTFVNATWCFRLRSNVLENEIALALIRLHPLKLDFSRPTDIVYKFSIKLGTLGYYSDNKYEVLYNKNSLEANSNGFRFPNSLLLAHQKTFAPVDDSLDIICYIFYEGSREGDPSAEDVLQTMPCIIENDDVAAAKAEQKKTSGTMSLKSTTAKSHRITWWIPGEFLFRERASCSYATQFQFADAKWQLKLYPNGISINDVWPTMSLTRLNSLEPTWHEIVYTFDVYLDHLRHNNPHYADFYFSENEEQVNTVLGMPEGFRLLDGRSALDNNAKLVCHLFSVESSVKDGLGQKMPNKLNICKTFHQNLKNLLLNGQGYDLILKVRDKEFRVHRHILSIRSQVFQSMLTHDMMEKKDGVVSVPDCNPEAMEQFLLYVYCGTVDVWSNEIALELYYLADKYNIMNLKDESRCFLKKSLSCSNFYDVVQLALTHSDKSLLEYTIDFSTKQNR